eukprot:GEMP01024889.1.p1 GENE.GEMP01024889.1~~GEMP01024889.1.p1  ORF type:complete len:788 (+),score=161.87 GEMP01024889.1:52-2364(+)
MERMEYDEAAAPALAGVTTPDDVRNARHKTPAEDSPNVNNVRTVGDESNTAAGVFVGDGASDDPTSDAPLPDSDPSDISESNNRPAELLSPSDIKLSQGKTTPPRPGHSIPDISASCVKSENTPRNSESARASAPIQRLVLPRETGIVEEDRSPRKSSIRLLENGSVTPRGSVVTLDTQKIEQLVDELRSLTEENKTLRGRVQKFSRMVERKVKRDVGVQVSTMDPIDRALETLQMGLREDTSMHIQVLLRSELTFPKCKQVVEACAPLLTSGVTAVLPLLCQCAETHELPTSMLQQVANACLHGCSRVPGTLKLLLLCGPALERDLLEATLELCFDALLSGEAPVAVQLITLYAPRTSHTLEQLERAMATTCQPFMEDAYVQCLTAELVEEHSLHGPFAYLCLRRGELIRKLSPALVRLLDSEYDKQVEPLVRKALEDSSAVIESLRNSDGVEPSLWGCIVEVLHERPDLGVVACSEVCNQNNLLGNNLIPSFCRYVAKKPDNVEFALEFILRLLGHWEATVITANDIDEFSVPQALAEGGAVDTLIELIVTPRSQADSTLYDLALSALKELFQLNAPAAILALNHFSSLDVVVSCVLDALQMDLRAFPDLQRQVLDYAISSFRRSPDLESKLINAVGFITRQDCSLINYVLDRPKEAPRAIRLEALRSIDSNCDKVDDETMQKLCRCLVRLLNEADVVVQHALQAILNLIQSDSSALSFIVASLGGSSDKEIARDKSVQNIMRVTHRFQGSTVIISRAQQLLDRVLSD